MKYTNGFFVFHAAKTEGLFNSKPPFVFEVWDYQGCIENFKCYTYSWLIRDEYGLRCEFHDAPVWSDTKRNIVVVFLRNELLISEVVQAIERKFQFICKPYSLNNRPNVMTDGSVVVPKIGISNIFNKVKTTLLRSDEQRIKVIESVLVGG